jgi:hypothetical protein
MFVGGIWLTKLWRWQIAAVARSERARVGRHDAPEGRAPR